MITLQILSSNYHMSIVWQSHVISTMSKRRGGKKWSWCFQPCVSFQVWFSRNLFVGLLLIDEPTKFHVAVSNRYFPRIIAARPWNGCFKPNWRTSRVVLATRFLTLTKRSPSSPSSASSCAAQKGTLFVSDGPPLFGRRLSIRAAQRTARPSGFQKKESGIGRGEYKDVIL